MVAFYELRAQSRHGIFAVPIQAGRRQKAQRLPDGAIVERPLPDHGCQARARPDVVFEVAAGGVPATVHHANLGLVVGFLAFSGVFLLSSGDVAAVYGAEPLPIDANVPTAL